MLVDHYLFLPRLSTHLGNGIASELPGTRTRSGSRPRRLSLVASLIADGHHLDLATLRVLRVRKGRRDSRFWSAMPARSPDYLRASTANGPSIRRARSSWREPLTWRARTRGSKPDCGTFWPCPGGRSSRLSRPSRPCPPACSAGPCHAWPPANRPTWSFSDAHRKTLLCSSGSVWEADGSSADGAAPRSLAQLASERNQRFRYPTDPYRQPVRQKKAKGAGRLATVHPAATFAIHERYAFTQADAAGSLPSTQSPSSFW